MTGLLRPVTSLFVILALAAVIHPASAQWVNISEPGRTYTDFAVHGSTIVVTNKGGGGEALITSPNLGQTWTFTTPLTTRDGRAVAATSTGFVTNLAGQVNYTASAAGNDWSDVPGPGSNVTTFFRDGETGRLYAGTQSANLLTSADEGATWSPTSLVSLDGEITWVHARRDTILAGYNQFGGDTFLSTDGGLTFIDTGLSSAAAGFVAENNDLYVLMSPFVSPTASAVLKRSTDGGQTWSDVTIAPSRGGIFGGQATPLRQQSLLFVSGQSIMYAPNDRIYVSHDGGASFTEMSENLVDAGARDSAIRRWQIVGDDMYVLVVDNDDEAPTSAGFGLYRRPLTELGFDATSVSTQEITLPQLGVALWPNPVRDRATLRLDLPAPGIVTVTTWDLLGREVSRAALGSLPAGSHDVDWAAAPTLGTGMYVIEIRAGERRVLRTVVKAE